MISALRILLVVCVVLPAQTRESLVKQGSAHATTTARVRNGQLGFKKQHASPLSRLTFGWADQMIEAGNRHALQTQDLWERQSAQEMAEEAEIFYQELSRLPPPKKKKSLLQSPIMATIWKLYRQEFILTAGLRLLNTLVQFLTPMLIKQLLTVMEEGTSGKQYGRQLAIALFLVQCSKTIIENQYFYWTGMLSVNARAALTSAMYRKLLRLDVTAASSGNLGDINNLAHLDAAHIEKAILNVHVLWDAILQTVVLTFMLYLHLGSSAFAGMLVFLVAVPLNTTVYKKLSKLRETSVKHNDNRLKIITEMLEGIYAIKAFGWEFSFMENIQDVRQAELKAIKQSGKVRALLAAGTNSLPTIVSVVTFITFALQGCALTPSKVFTALALLNQLRFPLTFYPSVISHLADTRISLSRLQPFFEMPEPLAIAGQVSPLGENDIREDGAVIFMNNCTFAWDFETKDLVDGRGGPSAALQGPGYLVDVNLNVRKGELVAVVGPIGSGKTTLLNAILGELRQVQGDSSLHGRLSYVPQITWIPSGTIRETILFGKPYDPVLYRSAIDGSGLTRDLELFDQGDETEVGERGATLSGGQKQRVSIARAIYHDADIYLLDDPLSALDSAVAEKVFDKGIRGCLAGKTRVMVTNHLSSLSRMDRIILMAQDSSGSMYIVDQGTYRELLSRGHDFVGLLQERQDKLAQTISELDNEAAGESPTERELTKKEPAETDAEALEEPDIDDAPGVASLSEESALLAATADGSSKPIPTPSDDEIGEESNQPPFSESSTGEHETAEHEQQEQEQTSRSARPAEGALASESNSPRDLLLRPQAETVAIVRPSTSATLIPTSPAFSPPPAATATATATPTPSPTAKKRLVKPEDRALGGVDKTVWTTYLKAAHSTSLLGLVVLFTFFANAAQLFQQFLMARWSHDPLHRHAPLLAYMGAMVLSAFVTSTFNFWRVFCAYIANTRAATTLHRDMLQKLLTAPIGYFIATPIGRLQQRFSRDFDRIDTDLPDMISTLLYSLFSIATAVIAVTAADPLLLLACVPIMAVFQHISRRFRMVSRDLKRLEALTRSPLNSHFRETLAGLSVIRCFNNQQHFIKEHHQIFNQHLAATWSLKAVDRWLSVRLESLGNTFVLLSGLFVVYSTKAAGLGGLSLTNALHVTSLLNWTIRTIANTESVMTSVERVVSVIRNTPLENAAPKPPAPPMLKKLIVPGPYASDADLVNSGWPWRGGLVFEGVKMRYRDDLPNVLDDISFAVHHGERIGIVGRSGSGKSSIFNALLGFAEMQAGTVKIDGIDVQSIHLSTLRNAVSIIPQEPILFSGTVRQNLDPLNQFTDERLWQALEKAKLEPTVRAMAGGLSARVHASGVSLSTGQRQLMCLARALLRRTRVLLLDEVTAAIDPDTEKLVQKTIREEFAGCTILAVAHRLHTILDSDKILVLDAGKILEFAPPLDLLRSRDSAFSQLLRQQQHQKE